MAEGDESKSQPFESAAEKEVIELIRMLYIAFQKAGMDHDEALERLGSTEAIGNRFELVEPTIASLLRENGN